MKEDRNKTAKPIVLHRRSETPSPAGSVSPQAMSTEDMQRLIRDWRDYQATLKRQDNELRQAQDELGKSRSKFHDLYDHAPVGYFSLDHEGIIFEANLTGANFLCTERQYLLGERFSAFVLPEQRDTFFYHRKLVIQTRMRQSCELILIKKDGVRFHCHLDSIPVLDAAGGELHVRTSMTDISQRVRSEEALKKSERDYRLQFSQMSSGAALHEIVCDDNGQPIDYRFLDVNPAFERLTGLSAADTIGRTVREVMPGIEERWIEIYGRVALTGEPIHFEDFSGVLDRYYEVSAYCPQEGQFAVIFNDITDRLQAQKTLQHRVALEQLVSSISSDFISLRTGRIDLGIQHALKRIGEFAEVDRAYLFLISNSGSSLNVTHEWCTPGTEPILDGFHGVALKDIPWWMERLNRFEPIEISDLKTLPPEAAQEIRLLRTRGVTATAVSPVVRGHRLTGFIGFDTVHDSREWSDDIVSLLKLAGEIFSHALERRQAESEREQLLNDMSNRIRELGCTYGVANAVRDVDSLEQMFYSVVSLIHLGMHAPDRTRARIVFDGREVSGDDFEESETKLQAPILADGQHRGHIEVCLVRGTDQDDVTPFSSEERDLLEGIAGTLGDAVSRKTAEIELRRTRARLEMIIRQSPMPIELYDPQGLLLSLNNACEICRAIDSDKKVVGAYNILDDGDSSGQALVEGFRKALDGQPSLLPEEEIRIADEAKSNDSYWRRSRVYPVSENGNVVNVVIIHEDITDHKRLEYERSRTQRLKSVELLAGGIANDFNNLLTTILGNVTLVGQESGDEQRQTLNEAISAVDRARHLTQQLLSFANGGEPMVRTFEAADLVRQALSAAMADSGSTSEFTFSGSLPCVEVDAERFNQVIQSVTSRLLAAQVRADTIWVHAEGLSLPEGDTVDLPPGHYLSLTVATSELATRTQAPSKSAQPGSGFAVKVDLSGLAVAQSIIREHGGCLGTVMLTPHDTAIKILLPTSHSPVPQTDFVALRTADQTMPASSGRILIVDDEDSIRDLVFAVLDKSGFHVDGARDGDEAIRMYEIARSRSQDYSIIILDLTIPRGMGGLETFENLRKRDPRVRAIICSGHVNDSLAGNFKEYGFEGFLPKPFHPNQLVKKLQNLLK